MGLRSRVILIFIAIAVLFISIEYGILRFSVFPGFVSLERDEAEKDMSRVVAAIQKEIYHLRSVCWDWSAWDDTYNFMETPSKEYVKSNLPLSTFTDNKINLFYFVDMTGKVVWGQIYDLRTEERMTLSDFPDGTFPKSHPLISYDTGNKPLSEANVSGVFMTEKGPMLITSCPILTSDNEGPARGFLILGRFLTDDVVKALVDQTQVPFDVSPIQSDFSPESVKDLLGRGATESPYSIQEKGEDQLLVYMAYPDFKGEPALLIKAEISKKISVKGYSTIFYALVLMFLSTVALFMVMLLFLQRTVLGPIAALTNHALSVKETGNLSGRLALDRHDEIGSLAEEFDRMLAKLETRANELIETNKRLKLEIEIRKQTEESLKESELRYHLFMKHFHGIAFQGTDPFKPMFLHGAIEKITGYTEDTLLFGVPSWEQIVHPDDIVKVREYVDRIMTTPNSTIEGEYRIIKKDGTIRWILEFISSVRTDSIKPITVQGARYDITDQKALETRLHQAQKMEAIGTLAGGVAHEFNNFLMTIVLNTEFTLKKLQKDSPVRESLGMSLEASYRARDLVEQILIFSRKGGEELFPLTVSPIVKEFLKIFRPSLPDSVEICSIIDCEMEMVVASPSLINQILINLFSNAAYAMRDTGGTLTVSLIKEIVDSKGHLAHPDIRPGPQLRLSVSDTGEGMPPEIVEKIFDPFFTTKRTGEGTGMGLSVVHGIVETLGGIITVRSEPGKGTVFDVFLPMIEGKESSAEEVFSAPRKGHGKILVVDDDELLIQLLERVLTDCGYQVTGKTNSVQALELFKNEPGCFDLVITDQNMPQMTGMDLAIELLSIRSDIPIILCTGSGDPITEEQSAGLGIRKIIRKPVGISVIAETVYSILNMSPEVKRKIHRYVKDISR